MTTHQTLVTAHARVGRLDDLSAAHGDFTAAYEAEARRLFTIALAILRDPGEAEDAVQETAALAWRAWGRRADPAATRAWLMTICVRCSLRRRRVRFRWSLSTTELTERVQPLTAYVAAEGRFLDLDRGYSRLTVRQRAVIFLHYHYGYSLVECAGLMRCSPGAVASHLSRALSKLRKEVTDD